MKTQNFLFFLLFFSTVSFGQVYKRVELTSNETKDKELIAHYKVNYEYVMKELFLYRNKKFVFNIYTDLGESYTAGDWVLKGDTLSLTSEFENKELPVQINYSNRSPSDTLIRKFAVVKDLKGKEVPLAAILINDSTVACFSGDMDCTRPYKTIDSVKISVAENISSRWLKVDTSKEVIHLVLQTTIDFDRYKLLNLRFTREKGNLRRLPE